jgi:DNA (cytosine-5)-methyltransferase 1
LKLAATQRKYPIVDLFAGPGGLGEGFAEANDDRGNARFHSVASIEHDEFSHQTLLLRHFFRGFSTENIPDDYYLYLNKKITRDELYIKYKTEFLAASKSALRISLGPENHAIVRRTINKRLGGKRLWALVGGPPCQAYSLVGRSRMMNNPNFENDERHFLYREYLKIIADHSPPVFVMENVKGLLSATIGDELAINRIVSDLANPKAAIKYRRNGLNYRLFSLSEEDLPGEKVDPRLFLLRAEQYGVPQARHRMFIVGIRSDLSVKPRQLKPHKPPTVRQTIGSLPSIRSTVSRGGDNSTQWQHEISKLSSVSLSSELNGSSFAQQIVQNIKSNIEGGQWPPETSSCQYGRTSKAKHTSLRRLYDERLGVLTGHEARGHMPSDLRRYMFAAVFAEVAGRSPKLSDFPQILLPKHKNVDLAVSGKMFSDRFRVQLPDDVATTITSHISKDGHYYIHYDPMQCRSLTVREAARLQTFPDNYKFEGPRTSQYHQVGNAVPPYLASQIASVIADVLDSVKGKD